MVKNSKVRITGPSDYHAKVMRIIEDSGCYTDLSDYVRSNMRMFILLCKTVFTPMREPNLFPTDFNHYLVHYMRQLRLRAEEEYSHFTGPGKTVSVSVPKTLYDSFKEMGRMTRTFDTAVIGIRTILLSDIGSQYAGLFMGLDELDEKKSLIMHAASDYKWGPASKDIQLLTAWSGKEMKKLGLLLSEEARTIALTSQEGWKQDVEKGTRTK